MRQAIIVILWLLCTTAAHADGVDWVRGGDDGKQTRWGIQGGLQFAIPPAVPGPRGLIRMLYPTLKDGVYDLVNFIAIEPIVHGQRAFSELEPSRLDGINGKRIWVDPDHLQGKLTRLAADAEILELPVHVEAFGNGARVKLTIRQDSRRPDEVTLVVHAAAGSLPMDACILTATMGNKARTRLLWLKNGKVSSLDIYGRYKQSGFTEHTVYPLNRLAITGDGEVLVAVTSDEPEPAAVHPFPNSRAWYYGGFPVTQFWKKPRGTWGDDLRVAVNARYTYWESERPVPGGVAFENFELREKFQDGRVSVFGISRKTPGQMGLGGK
ncbi:MAG: hypothetical protein ACHRHE_15000 [Tepidisphaerales bacterium]